MPGGSNGQALSLDILRVKCRLSAKHMQNSTEINMYENPDQVFEY